MNVCRRVTFWLATFALLAAVPLAAQTVAPATSNRGAQIKQAVATAAASFRAGNDDQGEAALAAITRCASNTAAWHVEQSALLVRLIVQQRSNGVIGDSHRGIQRALQHLNTAAISAGANDSLTAAMAMEQAGFISEHFLGDRTAAKAYYTKALQYAPKLATAQAALAWLNAGDAALLRKGVH